MHTGVSLWCWWWKHTVFLNLKCRVPEPVTVMTADWCCCRCQLPIACWLEIKCSPAAALHCCRQWRGTLSISLLPDWAPHNINYITEAEGESATSQRSWLQQQQQVLIHKTGEKRRKKVRSRRASKKKTSGSGQSVRNVTVSQTRERKS